jgi:hypothetical protein
MKHLTSEMKRQQIEWRRSKVLELSSQGYSEREISERLQPLAPSTVHRDLVYLRRQAVENIKTHISQRMPEEYHKVEVSITQVLKKAWEIVDKTADERIRLQALALIRECNASRLEMITNGTVVSDALKYVNGKAEKLADDDKTSSSYEEEEEGACDVRNRRNDRILFY